MKALIARRVRRGLTWVEIAEESGVPLSTLHWWHRRLRVEARDGRRRSRFVEVEVEPATEAEAGPIEVALRSGHRLLVPSGFDADDLRRLVGVLEPGC